MIESIISSLHSLADASEEFAETQLEALDSEEEYEFALTNLIFAELTSLTARASAQLIEKTAQLVSELNRVELEELK